MGADAGAQIVARCKMAPYFAWILATVFSCIFSGITGKPALMVIFRPNSVISSSLPASMAA